MNIVALFSWLSIIILLLWCVSTTFPLNFIRPTSTENQDLKFKSLHASFHSSLFLEIDLLSNPVDSYFAHRREYPFPFTEFFPAENPDQILCTPPYTEMVLKADIEGVLTSNKLDLKEHLRFSIEKLFEHVLFSFLLAKKRSGYRQNFSESKLTKSSGKYDTVKGWRNSTFHDAGVASLTGDRCSELLFIPPEPLPKNSFSFIAIDTSNIHGVERVIHYSAGDLTSMQDIVRLGVINLRKSLLHHYHKMRSSVRLKYDAVHVANLIKELALLIKKGKLHVSDGGDLYTPPKATIDHRCMLWLPRSKESWVYINGSQYERKVEIYSDEKNSVIINQQGDAVDAYDYGDQIEMLDIIPLHSSKNRLIDDPLVMQSVSALKINLGIKECLVDWLVDMQTKTWATISEFAQISNGLSCKQTTYRAPSGHIGNFCFSGPPKAKLRILLSKIPESNYLGSEKFRSKIGPIQTQFVSDLNSSTMEGIGYNFEKMYIPVRSEDNMASEDLSMFLFRRKGACNIEMPTHLRQNITKTWIAEIESMMNSDLVSKSDTFHSDNLINRLKNLEVICPCDMGKISKD